MGRPARHPFKSSSIALNRSNAASRSALLSAAMMPGAGRLALSSRASSLSQLLPDGPLAFEHALEIEAHGASERAGSARGFHFQARTLSPLTRLNSPALAVTRVAPRLRAWAAIRRSSGPMGVPASSRAARMSA